MATKSKHRGHILRAAIGLVVVLAVAACGEDTAGADPDSPEVIQAYENFVRTEMPGVPLDLVRAAAQEGTLTWYHLRIPAASAPLIAAFKERFPFIDVQEFEDSGTPLAQRFLTEQQNGVYDADVISLSAVSSIEQADSEGYLAEYTVSSQDAFPSESYKSGKWYAYGQTTHAVYMYNTTKVDAETAELLTSDEGFWSPEIQQLGTGIMDATQTVAGQVYFYYLEREYGTAAWDAIAAGNPTILGATALAAAVASGEVAVAAVAESIVFPTYDQGAPVAWIVPEPALLDIWPQGVAKNAPHPSAARLFHEFVLSKTGQSILQENTVPSFRSDVTSLPKVGDEPWFTPFQQRKPYPLDWDDIAANATRIVDDWKRTFLA